MLNLQLELYYVELLKTLQTLDRIADRTEGLERPLNVARGSIVSILRSMADVTPQRGNALLDEGEIDEVNELMMRFKLGQVRE
jgi:hypothetical protein